MDVRTWVARRCGRGGARRARGRASGLRRRADPRGGPLPGAAGRSQRRRRPRGHRGRRAGVPAQGPRRRARPASPPVEYGRSPARRKSERRVGASDAPSRTSRLLELQMRRLASFGAQMCRLALVLRLQMRRLRLSARRTRCGRRGRRPRLRGCHSRSYADRCRTAPVAASSRSNPAVTRSRSPASSRAGRIRSSQVLEHLASGCEVTLDGVHEGAGQAVARRRAKRRRAAARCARAAGELRTPTPVAAVLATARTVAAMTTASSGSVQTSATRISTVGQSSARRASK